MQRSLLFGLVLLLCTLQLHAQLSLVKTQGITSALHQTNIGKIIFTSKAIRQGELKEADFLKQYELTNKSNLFITVFMGNSLTNYLHQLAPDLPADSLVKVGNYQFSLFIDHKLIYESNLHPGAPYPQIKNFETTISKPLINHQNEGAWWSQSFWNRFLLNGGDSALTDGRHLLRMEIRPYVTTNEIKTGAIIAAGDLELLVNRTPHIDLAKIHLNRVTPYHSFQVSKNEFDQNRIRELKGYIDADYFKNISSIIVIKNGKLLIEEYFNGETRNTLHDPRSVGKSFASTLTGIAIHDGYLKNEDEPLKDFYNLKSYNHYSAEKENITIKQLLTMSSPFDGNDEESDSPGNEENMYPTDNWVKFALGLPLNTQKYHDNWHYFTAGVIVLGDILNKSVPGGLEKYADEKLLRPLDITRYQWQYTPQKVVNTAGSLQMSALDFAAYGQLYKNKGKWNGRQIIPEQWVNKTFSQQKTIPGRNNEFYGYLFWNKTYKVDNKNYETYYCAGNGGNSIFIFKDQPLVVVVTATAYGAGYAHTQVDKMMERYILPAVLNKEVVKDVKKAEVVRKD